MNFFDHKNLGYHLLQLCSKVVKHPVYIHSFNLQPFSVPNSQRTGIHQGMRQPWHTCSVWNYTKLRWPFDIKDSKFQAESTSYFGLIIRTESRETFHRWITMQLHTWENAVFWDVKPCILVEIYRRLRGMYCFDARVIKTHTPVYKYRLTEKSVPSY